MTQRVHLLELNRIAATVPSVARKYEKPVTEKQRIFNGLVDLALRRLVDEIPVQPMLYHALASDPKAQAILEAAVLEVVTLDIPFGSSMGNEGQMGQAYLEMKNIIPIPDVH